MEVRAKYSGYIERQQDEIDRQRRNEETALPANLDYASIANVLDVSPGTVAATLNAARRRLHEQLEEVFEWDL